MQCPQCQHENNVTAKFCEECGARLIRTCPDCGFEARPSAKFCEECGTRLTDQPVGPNQVQPIISLMPQTEPVSYTPEHLADKILTSRSALEGERKQVTVLFCDLANSTGLAEQLGPETMHTVLNEFFELALGAVHRYEGTINQFLGDGFMALFGAPIAHEDHGRRAVLAALELRRQLHSYNAAQGQSSGAELTLRMGLNTGSVVVGAIGDNLRMDYTAVGDTTNVAARLEQEAAPNQIVISQSTYRLVAGYCTTQALGAFALKGKMEPLEAWEVTAAPESRTRLDVETERGLTPFIGRDRELQTLHDCFSQAQAGQGQVVFLIGEAGIGKSRLLLEFRRQLGRDATWLEGHAMSFGQAMAFHPLIDLLKRNFRIEEGDPGVTIIEKIDRSVLRLGEDLRSALPYLRTLLSVDPGDATVQTMDPQLRRAEIFEALYRLMVRAAEVQPQVLVFEDLHWMDKATEDFLLATADRVPTSRVLCLFTYRPGYIQPFGERTYHTRMTLPTLSTTDSVQMAQAMLATEHLPKALEALIVRKAEGNPFFVEEVVKSLQEVEAIEWVEDGYILAKPLEEIEVPDSIQDVIMARIDRLGEAPKKTLQLAAVIGREFTYRLLDRLADVQEQTETYLGELKAIELIYERSLFPELAYMFKHALTQDVAYYSLLERRREELHCLIGRAIEELYSDRVGEQVEVIAYHFAKGKAWDKALAYFLKAADKATQAFAVREALALYDQALEAADHLGDDVDIRNVMAIHQAKGTLYSVLSNFEWSRNESERLLLLARQSGDRVSEGSALASMGFAAGFAHDFDRALADSRQAIEVGQAIEDKAILAAGYFNMAFVHAVTAQLDEAQQGFDQALAISREVGDLQHQSFSLSVLGILRNWEGQYADAVSRSSEGVQIAREHSLLFPLLNGLFIHGVTLTGRGNYDEAQATFEEGLELAEMMDDEINRHRLLNCLGWLHFECGNLDRALTLNRQSAEESRRRGDAETIANAELNLGDYFLSQGDLALAQDYFEGVYRLAHDPATSDWMKWRYSTHLFASLGELWLARGDPAKAGEFTEQCLDLATRTNSRKYLVKGWRLQGEIASANRQWNEAERWLRQALPLAQTIGNPPQLWKTHLALGRLCTAMNQSNEARQQYQEARDVIDRMKAQMQDPELRSSLENSPLFQELYEISAPDK